MFFVLWMIRTFLRTDENEKELNELAKIPVIIIFSTILMGMLISHFHLSRPLMSFLAIVNFRNSWLSREVLFTLLFFLSTVALISRLWISPASYRMISILGWVAIVFGLITLWCMTSVYLLPTQVSWNHSLSQFSSYGTALLLGVFSLMVVFLMDIRFSLERESSSVFVKIKFVNRALKGMVITAIVAAIWIFFADLNEISLLQNMSLESAQISLNLLFGIYKPLLIMRFSFLTLGTLCFSIYSIGTLIGKQKIAEMIKK